MENARGKKKNSTKQSEGPQASGVPNTQRTSGKGTKRKSSEKVTEASCPKRKVQGHDKVKRLKKRIPPLPPKLPPVNLIHRDTIRVWCQQLKLSTKGQKLDTYRRLCEYAYPDQKNIPDTAEEAKMLSKSRRKLKINKGEIPPETFENKMFSEGTDPPEVVSPPESGTPALATSTACLVGGGTVVAATSTPGAVFDSWATMAAKARKTAAVDLPREPCGLQWCVVHGRSLPADSQGWARLQFHAGQAWVPDKRGKVCALFLLPACSFPPTHLEDNMLCPKCVHRQMVKASPAHGLHKTRTLQRRDHLAACHSLMAWSLPTHYPKV